MLLFNACLYLVFRLNAVVNSMAYGICHLLKYRNTFYLYKHIVACFLWVFYVSLVLLCSSHLRFYVLFVIVWLSWLIFMYFFPIFGILCFNWCCSVHPVRDFMFYLWLFRFYLCNFIIIWYIIFHWRCLVYAECYFCSISSIWYFSLLVFYSSRLWNFVPGT
jgi:hypothetical protein